VVTVTWPVVELDAITRLRAVAAAFPNAGVGEVVLDVPFDDVWSWMMDFERTTARFDTAVRKVRIRSRTTSSLRMWAWSRGIPVPFHFDARIEPGFCMMRATGRAFLVLMAAVPDGDGRTRYAHAEAVPLPGLARLRPRLQRMVDADLGRLQRVIGS
jgi:hypothetical protein